MYNLGTLTRDLKRNLFRIILAPNRSRNLKVLELIHRAALGQPAEPNALTARIAEVEHGKPFADVLTDIMESDEARLHADNVRRSLQEASFSKERLERLAGVVALAYRGLLAREANASDVEYWVSAMKDGLRVEEFLFQVSESDEGQASIKDRLSGYSAIVELVYATLLGREPSEADRETWQEALRCGLPIPELVSKIAISEEAQVASRNKAYGLQAVIKLVYANLLERLPSQSDLEIWEKALRNGLPVVHFLEQISGSEERKAKQSSDKIGPNVSDGQFLISVGERLLGRGLLPKELVAWQRELETVPDARRRFLTTNFNAFVEQDWASEAHPPPPHNSAAALIMGTERTITRAIWDDMRRGCKLPTQLPNTPWESRTFQHSGIYKISLIASLYEGGDFITRFLDNITAQSMFDRAELIIVDANSPDREWNIIEQYQRVYPNIVYKRFNSRIGIYEAWNVAVELSRGGYLTNTNLDDLRRHDSIELQASYLDNHSDVDVTYQDFFYTFDHDLAFEQIAALDVRSALPIVTPHNLLEFNSPHNAPMWRKSLHVELGRFDSSYRSAGDWEFWLRCMAAGKRFGKINTPHVTYYQNPRGISTRPDTAGLSEAHRALRQHSRKLISSVLTQSRAEFAADIGVQADLSAVSPGTPYFDIAQTELLRLGTSRGRTGEKLNQTRAVS